MFQRLVIHLPEILCENVKRSCSEIKKEKSKFNPLSNICTYEHTFRLNYKIRISGVMFKGKPRFKNSFQSILIEMIFRYKKTEIAENGYAIICIAVTIIIDIIM